MQYRSEIDGLRAIAVISVVLYHAQIIFFDYRLFPGGFLGVDIFFVISGYLISSNLYTDLLNTNKINFFDFYERRARRIIPLLFFVILVTFVLSYKYLLPNQFLEYSQSATAAIFFSSNIFFYLTNTLYGAENSLIQPLLHTWSLGVEEQFYILFPIILFISFRIIREKLFIVISMLLIISLIYSNWQSDKNIQLNYLMLASRFWELGIGSLIAFYEIKYGKKNNRKYDNLLTFIGLSMMIIPIFFYNNQTPHPSFKTLIPIIGTGLIILYCSGKKGAVKNILTFKPFLLIGLISYSLYLWHYPIFAFARIANNQEINNFEKLILIFLTFIISLFSYFFIENTFKSKEKINKKKFVTIFCVFLTIFFVLFISSIKTEGYKNRYHKIPHYNFNFNYYANEVNKAKKESLGIPYIEEKIKVLILGESHARDIFNGLIRLKEAKEEYDFKTYSLFDYKQGENKQNIVKNLFNNEHYKKSEIIIINFKQTGNRIKLIDSFIKKALNDNKKIILLSHKTQFKNISNKVAPSDIYLINNYKKFKNDNLFNLKKIINKSAYNDINGLVKTQNDQLKEIAKKNNIIYVDITKYICDDNNKECYVIIEPFKKAYFNRDHWTNDGAEYYMELVWKSELKKIFSDLINK